MKVLELLLDSVLDVAKKKAADLLDTQPVDLEPVDPVTAEKVLDIGKESRPMKITLASGEQVIIRVFNAMRQLFVRIEVPSAKDHIQRIMYRSKAVKEQLLDEKWNDSGASDANGRWAKYRDGEIGVEAMATWLYNSRVHKKTKAEKLKSAMGAISQQQNTSKLISTKQADALRAALKRKYGSGE
jgi:hypothetical protein